MDREEIRKQIEGLRSEVRNLYDRARGIRGRDKEDGTYVCQPSSTLFQMAGEKERLANELEAQLPKTKSSRGLHKSSNFFNILGLD
jgi:hypothetical protein